MLSDNDNIMPIVLKAIYENGVFRPLEPVDLQDRQTITLTLNDVTEVATPDGESHNLKLPADKRHAAQAILDSIEPVTVSRDSADIIREERDRLDNRI